MYQQANQQNRYSISCMMMMVMVFSVMKTDLVEGYAGVIMRIYIALFLSTLLSEYPVVDLTLCFTFSSKINTLCNII